MKTGIIAFVLAAAGFSFFIWLSHPGFMSPDSFSQYGQALSRQYLDSSPPVMSWLWSLSNRFVDGPQGMLYLQLFLLWSGFFLWSRNFAGQAISILFVLVGFAPWVANFEAVIWKDIQMAGALVLVTALLGRKKISPALWPLMMLVGFYAFMVRINAPAALIPIIWYALSRLDAFSGYGRRTFATVAALGCMFLLTQFFNYQLLDAKKSHIVDFMLTDDLVNLSVVEGRSLFPGVDFDEVKDCSLEVIGETTLVGRVFCLSNRKSYLEAQPISHEALMQEWERAALAHPFEMIKHRIRAFLYFLRSPSEKPYIYFYAAMQGDNIGIPLRQNAGTDLLRQYVGLSAARMPFLFKPYFWLIAGIVLFIGSFFLNRSTSSVVQARMLILSGLLYLFGYLPLAPMADFRYAYWTTISISLAAVLLLASFPWPGRQRNANVSLEGRSPEPSASR